MSGNAVKMAAEAVRGRLAARAAREFGGGATAAGFARWGLAPGARADLLVPDPADPVWVGLPAAQTLDALVFSGPARPFARTLVAGRWVPDDDVALFARGAAALQALHGR